MVKRIISYSICFMYLLSVQQGTAQVNSYKTIHIGLYAGMGLPRVPFSIYHPPISILGGGMINVQIMRRFLFQLDGLGLYTINLGTLTGEKKEFRYNVYGGSLNLLYAIRRTFSNDTFITIGFDDFFLSQKFDVEEDILTTTGMNLGLVYWKHHERWSGLLELRWHLLFNPTPNPQMLIITFGVLM
jgi:hypothetical protein